jgi:superfamily II DNA or RNA helicase
MIGGMPESPLPLVDEVDLENWVGPGAFSRGHVYAHQGSVDMGSVRWDAECLVLTGYVQGTASRPYFCEVVLAPVDGGGYRMARQAFCSCPVGHYCKHVAALVIVVNALSASESERLSEPWQWAMLPFKQDSAPIDARGAAGQRDRLGLEFRLHGFPGLGVEVRSWDSRSVWVRPVEPAAAPGRWRGTRRLSWESRHVPPDASLYPPGQVEWFLELARLRREAFSNRGWLDLAALDGPLLWPWLDKARDLGIALTCTQPNVTVEVRPATRVTLDLTQEPGQPDMVLRPVLEGSDEQAGFVQPLAGAGIGCLTSPDPAGNRQLLLMALAAPLDRAVDRVLAALPLRIDAQGKAQFLREYYPQVARAVAINSTDGSVDLPELARPVLVFSVSPRPEAGTLEVGWEWNWSYKLADAEHLFALKSRDALNGDGFSNSNRPSNGGGAQPLYRDLGAEAELARRAGAVCTGRLERVSPQTGAHGVCRGSAVVAMVHQLIGALKQVHGVEIRGAELLPDLQDRTEDAAIGVVARPSGDKDWLDLGVVLRVDGHEVPFVNLFQALARGQKHLVLPHGGYIDLEAEQFGRLRELIDEAGRVSDRPRQVRISRFDAELWGRFEDVADEIEADNSWRSGIAALQAFSAQGVDPPLLDPPAGLRAHLREYQLIGFSWLAFLWEHQLGGVLADDMGLGKTVEALALIARARERSEGEPPFLVVAPASVVSNWVSEAQKFVPGLVARAVTQGGRKLAYSLQDLAGVDIVVTSYALFRINFDQWSQWAWAGLILDEAQFAKNPKTKVNECARQLPAPFKLAITGTPMENNLMELWAVFTIVAPGLLSSQAGFRQDYMKEIAAQAAAGLPAVALARLRRRLRPLLLRRTKEQVAPELPERQELELALDLDPKHRRVYDTYLHRERRRLLGLLDSFEENRFEIFRSLTLLRRLALDASLVDPVHAAVPSSKLDALFEQLRDVIGAGHRALVFSQFTSYLDKVAQRCQAQGIAYEHLDGSTTKRPQVIERFKKGTAPLFLLSLKAGGVGLNLTEADYVFLLDPWWNPATENQAIDRAHRIGQDKPVIITRLVAAGTIEEKVMRLKQRKAELFTAVLDEGEVFSQAMTAQDIRLLLADQ